MAKKKYTQADKERFKKKNQENIDGFVKGVSEKLLDIIDQSKDSKWAKPWKDLGGAMPYNPVSDIYYTRTNNFALVMDILSNTRGDNRYCTFKQAKKIAQEHDMEIDIKDEEKGKGTSILVPVFVNKKVKAKENEQENDFGNLDEEINKENKGSPDSDNKDDQQEGSTKKVLVGYKVFKVFNAEQFTDFPKKDVLKDKRNWDDTLELEKMENLVFDTGVHFKSGEIDKACYNYGNDTILIPLKEAFDKKEKYYGTLAHEWYHSTMHEKRENRREDGGNTQEEYALEELRAESFSILAGFYMDMPIPVGNHTAYLQNWNSALENNPKDIEKQIAQASKVFDKVFVPYMNDEYPKVDWEGAQWFENAIDEEEEFFGPK